MKQNIETKQLKELSEKKLFTYANMLQIKDAKEKDITKLYNKLEKLSTMGTLVNLLCLVREPNMNYDETYKTWMVDFGDKKQGIEKKELIDALWEAVVKELL